VAAGLAAWLAAGAVAGPGAPTGSTDRAVQRAVERMYRSLVRLMVVAESPASGRLEKQLGSGSGVIISEEGHIITNHHVAGRASRLLCRLYDGEELDGWLVAADALTDIAVVQLDLSRRKPRQKLHAARFGDSDRLRLGDVVLAMGCPAGVSQSVTRGIVSNTQLMLPSFAGGEVREEGEAVGSVVRWIGHDAVIFPGNSGGPLVNLQGEIVGINEIAFGSLGGAIPANLAREVARQLIAAGRVERSWTGIEGQPRPKNLAADRGVLVSGVLPDSPAAEAGLRPGDVLLEYDGVAVNAALPEDVPLFNRLLLSTPVGRRVALRVWRQGQPLQLTLTTRPRGRAQGEDTEFREWGFVARDLTRLAALELRRPDTNGVQVVSVGLAGPAADAKPPLANGDVLVEVGGRRLGGVADLRAFTEQTLRDASERRAVLVKFDRDKVRYLTVVRIGKDPKRPEVELSRKAGLSAELQALSAELAEALGLKGQQGALVTLVYPGYAAERAGLRQGDVLVKLDGEPVRCQRPEDVEDVYGQVRRYRIGRQIECEVLRDGQSHTLTLTLEEDLRTAEDRQRYQDDVFDLTLERLTALDRIHRDLPADLQGVKIVQVETGGWAHLARVRGNDILLAIDGEPTPDVPTAERLLKRAAAARARSVLFFIRRGIHTLFAEVEPAWPRRPESGDRAGPVPSPSPPTKGAP